MAKHFLGKLTQRDKEARASVSSYRLVTIGFGFGAIVELLALLGELLAEPMIVDYLSIFFFIVFTGLFFLCLSTFKKAKEYLKNLKKDPHKYIDFRAPYPWHWWFNNTTGSPGR